MRFAQHNQMRYSKIKCEKITLASSSLSWVNRLANFFIKVANINCRFKFQNELKTLFKTNLNVKYFSDSRNRKSDKNCQTQDKLFTFELKNKIHLEKCWVLWLTFKMELGKTLLLEDFKFCQFQQAEDTHFDKNKNIKTNFPG